MKTGFIGLGSQGAPMARRMIDAGFDVTLWARRPESLAPYADTNAKNATSVAELGAAVDHVGICVLKDADVREVCDTLIPAMRKGSRIAIHSTVLPETAIAVAQQAAARGIDVLDAPVSGGEPGAKAGTLTIMVGGDKNVLEAARPVFQSFGKLIVHLGEIGAGQHAKLINNTLMAANVALAHHALEASNKLGLNRAAFIELIKESSGRSFGFEAYSRAPNPQAFAFAAALLAKDTNLLAQVLPNDDSSAGLCDVALPIMNLALQK